VGSLVRDTARASVGTLLLPKSQSPLMIQRCDPVSYLTRVSTVVLPDEQMGRGFAPPHQKAEGVVACTSPPASL